MVGESDALLQGAQREQRGVHLSARAMEGGKDVHLKVAGLVQRVSMEVPTSVWHMGEERGVPCLSAQKVLGDGPTTVCVMVGASGASLKVVARVLKAVQIFARHMVEERDVLGAIQDQNLAANLLVLVTRLQGEKRVFVLSTVVYYKIRGFMEALP